MEKKLLILLCFFIFKALQANSAVPVDLSTPPLELATILERLNSGEAFKSQFVESRENPFHNRPKRFEGHIYFHPQEGLCLDYTKPSFLRLIVSDKQILMLRADQEPRIIQSPDESAFIIMISRLFEWEIEWIQQSFATTAQLDDNSWKLILSPNEGFMSRQISKIELSGVSGELESIKLHFRGNRDLTINLYNQEHPWKYLPEDLSKLYPSPDADN